MDRGAHTPLLEAVRGEVDPAAGRIPAWIFSDSGVHALEQDSIFLNAWLFVAHVTELPRPGDFVTRDMGTQPVIVSHGSDGRFRVFLNFCRHRGMRLCRVDAGRETTFVCPYHGISYQNTGELAGIPFQQDVYSQVNRDEWRLFEAEVSIYHGLIFASWDPIESLEEFLGPMTWYLDLAVHRSEMEVMGPPQRWRVETNWKLASDNFMDSYHLMYAHGSIGRLKLIPSVEHVRRGYQIVPGKGHGLGIGLPNARPLFPETVIQNMPRYLSPEQTQVLLQLNNLAGTVFPNFSILISSMIIGGQLVSFTTIRLYQPLGANETVFYSWGLVERDAPDEWKALSRDASVLTFSPSGMLEQDDAEVLTHVSRNLNSSWIRKNGVALRYDMGRHKVPASDFPGPGMAYSGKFMEASPREFYGRWKEMVLMSEREPLPNGGRG